MSSSNKFWMVWNPSGRNPTHKHYRREHAEEEAKRLSVANPGERFFVLKAVDGFTCEPEPPRRIKLRWADDSEIPF